MEDVSEAFAYVQKHQSELLTDTAVAELEQRLADESDPARRQLIEERLKMLQALKALRDELAGMSADEQLFMAFLSVTSPAQLMDLATRIPDQDLDTLEQTAEAKLAEAEGDEAEGLRQRLDGLREVRRAQSESSRDPIMQAVIELIQTEDEAAAQQLLDAKGSLLLTMDARNHLEEVLNLAKQQQNEALRTRVEVRLTLWHAMRSGSQPETEQTPLAMPGEQLSLEQPRQLEQQSSKYTIIEASHCAIGDNAQTLNILNVGRVPLEWKTPHQFRTDLSERAVGRVAELDELDAKLQGTASAAVVGKGASRSQSGAVRGLPGVGKSTLAALYAEHYQDRYPGGVIWLQLGPSYTTPESVGPVISELAAFAYSGDVQAYQALSLAQSATSSEQILSGLRNALFKPEAVRLLLSGRGPLLVVADDVWDRSLLAPIRAALPPDASLLVTTRDSRIANGVGNALELDVLSEPDALAMISRALPDMDPALANELALTVGHHPLALEIALGDLAEQDPEDWAECIAEMGRRVTSGESLDFLPLSDDIDRTQRLVAVLRYSYDALEHRPGGKLLQQHFRTLGTFAPEAEFATDAVTALWESDNKAAKDHLQVFRARSLMSGKVGRWHQHSILRGYALHLQGHEERLRWAERHASHYLARMREADDAQRYYIMAPELPNLRHAFDWAVQEGLEMAQDLVGNSADLLRSQNLGAEYLAWAERVLDRSKAIGGNSDIGQALTTLGNALQAASTLAFGEDRAARLREALAAYDEALERRRDVPLAYATTQNNRANLLSDLASLPGEDRAARLRQALILAIEAVEAFGRHQQAQYQQASRMTLAGLIVVLGSTEFGTLWEQLRPGQTPPQFTSQELMIASAEQEGVGSVEELQTRMESDPDLVARLQELLAFAHDEESGEQNG